MRRKTVLIAVSLIALVLFAACGLFKVEYRLRVDIEGEGNVYPNTGKFESGTVVTFDVQPEDEWLFSRWEGPNKDDVTKEDGDWKILIDGEKELTAVFDLIPFVLTVNEVGGGHVTQEIVQPDLESLSTEYPPSTFVKLTAIEDTGWEFQGWSGDAEGTDHEIIVEMDEDKEITATFVELNYDVNINIVGRGSVEKEVLAGGLSVPFGKTVRLTAVADEGFEFVRWQGDASGSEDIVDIEVDGVINVTAVFTAPALSGYVTLHSGGPAVEGAKLFIEEVEVGSTDEAGYFLLEKNELPEGEFDLFIKLDGETRALVQDIHLEDEEFLELAIPIKERFNSEWPDQPARIAVTGVERGDTLSGEVPIELTLDFADDLVGNVIYLYFCGLQRSPVTLSALDSDTLKGTINTLGFPNGDGFIRIVVFDNNDNLTLTYIPVTIENDPFNDSIPGDLQYLGLLSITFGQTIEFYSQQRVETFERYNIEKDPHILELPTGQTVDLRSFSGAGTIFTQLEWEPVDGAHGYEIYRSNDGINFKKVGDVVLRNQFQDYGPALTPGKAVFYKVVPYNSYGKGNSITRGIMPLKPYNVTILAPANDAKDVPLQPKFTWEDDGNFPEGTTKSYDFQMFEATRPYYYPIGDLTDTELDFAAPEYDITLEPGAVYTWDIIDALAFCTFYFDADGYSQAQSIAGADSGSLNGEFIFTTTLEVD